MLSITEYRTYCNTFSSKDNPYHVLMELIGESLETAGIPFKMKLGASDVIFTPFFTIFYAGYCEVFLYVREGDNNYRKKVLQRSLYGKKRNDNIKYIVDFIRKAEM